MKWSLFIVEETREVGAGGEPRLAWNPRKYMITNIKYGYPATGSAITNV